MRVLARIYYAIHDGLFGLFRHLDGLAPLLLRLYLAPVMIAAGLHKWHNYDDMVGWFGNAEWGLGLPNPELMVTLATATEIVGGLLLLFGLAVRWAAIPLMATMLVAAFAVHWENGWFAIAPGNPETSTAKVLADMGVPAAQESLENSVEVGKRVAKAKEILREHGNYEWLTEKGGFVVLNNGIEYAATYFIMLLALFFTGGGRYVSFDYYLDRQARRLIANPERRAISEPSVAAPPSPETAVKDEQVEQAPGAKWAAKRKAREMQAADDKATTGQGSPETADKGSLNSEVSTSAHSPSEGDGAGNTKPAGGEKEDNPASEAPKPELSEQDKDEKSATRRRRRRNRTL